MCPHRKKHLESPGREPHRLLMAEYRRISSDKSLPTEPLHSLTDTTKVGFGSIADLATSARDRLVANSPSCTGTATGPWRRGEHSYSAPRARIFLRSRVAPKRGQICREIKGRFCQPDREFESNPLRQLVHCFSRENLFSRIVTEYPGLSPSKVEPSGRRARVLEKDGPLGPAHFSRSAIPRSG